MLPYSPIFWDSTLSMFDNNNAKAFRGTLVQIVDQELRGTVENNNLLPELSFLNDCDTPYNAIPIREQNLGSVIDSNDLMGIQNYAFSTGGIPPYPPAEQLTTSVIFEDYAIAPRISEGVDRYEQQAMHHLREQQHEIHKQNLILHGLLLEDSPETQKT